MCKISNIIGFKSMEKIFLWSKGEVGVFVWLLETHYPHNIIQIHIQSECGEYPRLLRGILSIPLNVVMDLNNVVLECEEWCISC